MIIRRLTSSIDQSFSWTAFDTGVPLVARFYVDYPSCMYQARLNVSLTYNGTP